MILKVKPIRNRQVRAPWLLWPAKYYDTAKKFDNQEPLPIPANHILAIVSDSDEARAAVEALAGYGFSPDDVGILTGRDDAGRLNAATGKEAFSLR
jgi:hypothetical protein